MELSLRVILSFLAVLLNGNGMKFRWLASVLVLLLGIQWVDAQTDAYALHPAQPDLLRSTDAVLEKTLHKDVDGSHAHCCHCHGLTSLFTSPHQPHSTFPLARLRMQPAAADPVASLPITPEHRPPIA